VGDQGALVILTNVPVDDRFSSPRQIRWSAALGKLLIADRGNNRQLIRNSDLLFYSKINTAYNTTIDSDVVNVYASSDSILRKFDLSVANGVLPRTIASIRMIDTSGDPDYVYVTSNNTTDHHGFRQIKKSTMAVTASALADGSGDGQFDDPLGIFYYNSEVFVADYDNSRISVWTKSGETMTYNRKYDLGFKPIDLAFDGTNWFVQSETNTYKYDNVFTDATKVSTACVGYSLTIIPDQSDGNGATLGISNKSSNCLYRRKCSDLSLVATVGSSGDGSSTLFDPVVTGCAGTWTDDAGGQYVVASAANISKNGFSGDFWASVGHKIAFKPASGKTLADITAIDFNTDAIQGEIKNLRKCVNCTSYKLYANTALIINLVDISSKATIVQIYSCGLGVIPADLSKCVSANDFRLQDNSWNTAQVDQFIQWIYAGRAGFTDVARSMRIGANNGAPTGNYTDPAVTPGNGSSNSDWSWDVGLGYHLPLTPNAMVYRLLHAVEAGVSSWSTFSTA
jgi:hypothetical protein